MAHYYHYQQKVKTQKLNILAVLVAVLFTLATLSMAVFSLTNRTSAEHTPTAAVSNVVGACGETTFTANRGGLTVTNMFLVVSVNGETQYKNITDENIEISVGPFESDTTVLWRVFGGGERSYDTPHWNGFGDADFTDNIVAYADEVGSYSWVVAGPEDPNPFTTWHSVDVEGCEKTAMHAVNGGGHLLEGSDKKRKDMSNISFGVDVTDYGVWGSEGSLDVRFHNVANNELDKTSFHATEIVDFNYFNGNSSSCEAAVNLTAMGSWNGTDGYKMILRSGDNGSPNTEDTVRLELFDETNTKVYDTLTSDFGGGSDCVGSARTDLDKGNLTIQNYTE